MARPREFDVDEALDAALDAFWRRGYAATSMADLMQAMGLEKSSIYKVWDSKQDLFEKALTRYQDRGFERFSTALEQAPSPLEGLRRCLGIVGEMCHGEGSEKGCFAVNTTVELGALGDAARSLTGAHRKRAEKLLATAVERAQELGELSADVRPALAARYLLAFTSGLHVSGQAGLTRNETRDLIELALRGLE